MECEKLRKAPERGLARVQVVVVEAGKSTVAEGDLGQRWGILCSPRVWVRSSRSECTKSKSPPQKNEERGESRGESRRPGGEVL